jgi:hypothetical protein
MSEKVIDPMSLLAQVRPDADPHLKRLFEMRVAEEFEEEQAERRAAEKTKDVRFGPVPDAQVVYNAVSHTTGVAVRGAKFICPLPKGYGGPGCELAMVPQGLIVIQPDKQPLLINPENGTTRRL